MFPESPGSLVSRASYSRHTLVLKSFAELLPVPSAKTAITLGIDPSRRLDVVRVNTEGAAGTGQVTGLLDFSTGLQSPCTAAAASPWLPAEGRLKLRPTGTRGAPGTPGEERGHERERAPDGSADPVWPGPSSHRRRRPLGRVRFRLQRADEKGRRRQGCRWVHGRAEDHAGRARHVARRAAAPAPRPAGVLDPPGRQHARSRDRHDAAPALRASRRVRLRFRDYLSDGGPARAADRR